MGPLVAGAPEVPGYGHQGAPSVLGGGYKDDWPVACPVTLFQAIPVGPGVGGTVGC